MRILITTDDGVESRGLGVLAAAVADAGHDVVVVAPDRDQSGCGAGIGDRRGRVVVDPRTGGKAPTARLVSYRAAAVAHDENRYPGQRDPR